MNDHDKSCNTACDGNFERMGRAIQTMQQSFSVYETMDQFYKDIAAFLKEKKKALKKLAKDPSKKSFRFAIKQAHAKIIEELMDHREIINTELRGKTYKIIWEFKRIIDLLTNSDEIKVKNNFNYDLLDTAIVNGYTNIVKDFLDYGLDINSIYNSRLDCCCAALHRAAQSKQEKMAEILIKSGANVNLQNNHRKTALFYSTKIGCYNISKMLLENGAKINDPWMLYTAVTTRNLQMVKLLIEHGADINVKDCHGRTALHFVTVSKKSDSIRLRFRYEDSIRMEIARLLIENGANVDAKTKSGITTLHAAALKGYSHVVEILLRLGARVDMPTFDNKTAIFFAAYNAYGKVVNLLLKYGANINCMDKDQRTVADMAYLGGDTRFAMVCDDLKPSIEIVSKYTRSPQHQKFDADYSDYDHYDRSFYPGYRNKTLDIINKHVVKLTTAGFYVRPEISSHLNLKIFSYLNLIDDFKAGCKDELDSIKKVVVVNKITINSIIQMDLNQLAIYLRNERVLEALQGYNYSIICPLYENVIRGRISQAIRRNETLIGGYEMLEAILSFSETLPQLPAICIEKIIEYVDSPRLIYLNYRFSGFTLRYQKKIPF